MLQLDEAAGNHTAAFGFPIVSTLASLNEAEKPPKISCSDFSPIGFEVNCLGETVRAALA